MNFAEELMEFHPATAVRLLELICLIAVILFAVISKKTFGKISGNFLISFFALSRLPDILTTIICLKKVDYSHEANFLLRWLLNTNLPEVITILLFNLIVFLLVYLLYKLVWNYSSLTKTAIKISILTFSLIGLIFTAFNIIFFLNL